MLLLLSKAQHHKGQIRLEFPKIWDLVLPLHGANFSFIDHKYLKLGQCLEIADITKQVSWNHAKFILYFEHKNVIDRSVKYDMIWNFRDSMPIMIILTNRDIFGAAISEWEIFCDSGQKFTNQINYDYFMITYHVLKICGQTCTSYRCHCRVVSATHLDPIETSKSVDPL